MLTSNKLRNIPHNQNLSAKSAPLRTYAATIIVTGTNASSIPPLEKAAGKSLLGS